MFDSGTMHWCATASDALMLRAYEEATGATAILLWDCATSTIRLPAGGYHDAYVVLSSAGWRWGPTAVAKVPVPGAAEEAWS